MKQNPTPNSLQARLPSLVELSRTLAVSAGILHILLVVFVCVSRLSYPYELEWLEGASLIQVERILEDKPFYSPPSLENISVVYMPFYYYLSAFLAKFMGLSFTPLRIVSFSASIGIGLLIFLVVKKETESKLYGIVATGIFAASFELTSGWYDIARTDTLALFFTFAALVTLRSESRKAALLSGLLFAAAFYTKQTTLPFPLFALGYILLFERHKFFWLGLSFFAALAIGWGILSAQNWEWLNYYVISLPANTGFKINRGSILRGLRYLLFPISFVTILLFIWFSTHARRIFISPSRRYYWSIALVATGISMMAFFIRGGWINNFMPAYISYAILFGLGLDSLVETINTWRNARLANVYLILLWCGCIAQFLVLAYNPITQIPSDDDARAGNLLVSKIKGMEGDVLIPGQNYLALLANKEPFFHHLGLTLINGEFGNKPMPEWKQVETELDQAIRDKQFTAIILDSPNEKIEMLLGCFKKEIIEYESADSFFPIEGDNSRPAVIYTACQN